MKWSLVVIGFVGAGFGAYAMHLGHNSVVIGSVFGLLGTIAGYLIGQKTSES